MTGGLQGVRFEWIANHGGRADVGFVAEDVAEVVPELVTCEEEGVKASGLKYDHLTAVAVEAIKELRAEQNEEMTRPRAENEVLRGRLASLEHVVAQLASNGKEQRK